MSKPLAPIPATEHNIAEFDSWIASLGLKHFQPYELRQSALHRLNGLPPHEYWDNIVPTIRTLDRWRSRRKEGISINSSYRSQRYNASIGGASNSNHMYFCALDWHYSNRALPITNALKAEVFAFLEAEIAAGRIERAGLGFYPAMNFLHIDCNHDNGARPKGKVTSWRG